MPKQRRLLTKTAFGYGLVCDRLLWMYQNARDELPETDESTQAIFDQAALDHVQGQGAGWRKAHGCTSL